MRGAYGNPEAPAEESEMNLALLEDIAPTVQRLVSGLPPAEQAAVLRSKIQTLQPYASAPVVGFFARQRISQYQASEIKFNLLALCGSKVFQAEKEIS